MEIKVEEVKALVEAGAPTTSTVAILRLLLGAKANLEAQRLKKLPASKANGVSSSTATANKKSKPAVGKSKTLPTVPVHEDAPHSLSGREKYALATHCVNCCLKHLTDSLKSQHRLQDGKSSPTTRNTNSASDVSSPRALQVRSGNISPVRSSPKKSDNSDDAFSASPQKSTKDSSLQIRAMAECAQQSFSFLLNADFKAIGVREMPPWQLENGLLALVSKLISYGMIGLAAKQLWTVKERLEAACGGVKAPKPGKPPRAHSGPDVRDALVDLLRFQVPSSIDQGALSAAITYQQYALKLISSRPTAAALETLHEHIAIDLLNSPVELIIRQAKVTKDFAKASKQLEALSRIIINLGPGIALSEDGIAKDSHKPPSPQAMLKLQTTALRIRRLWWKLAKHQPDVCHELLEPFFKCASAYVRRANHELTEEQPSKLLSSCFESLGSFDRKVCGNALFPIHNLVYAQTLHEKSYQNASKWAEEMAEDCVSLDRNHARVAVALISKATLSYHDSTLETGETLTIIASIMQSKITGTSADYETLIDTMNSLSHAVLENRTQATPPPHMLKVLILNATFCQRYARSYPGRKTQQMVMILNAGLRYSQSTDELLTWLSRDSANVFVESGALKTVVEAASTRPLLEVWSISRNALSLSRIVNALLLKAARSNADANPSLFDDETLSPAERGILLEWQLRCAADLAPRVKYHDTLKKLLPDLLRRLAKIYVGSEYPIRRMRVATIAFEIRERHPNLIPPHCFKIWQDSFHVNSAGLGQDAGLAHYRDDLMARLAISRQFAETQPTTDGLMPHLQSWDIAISSCSKYQGVCDHFDDPYKVGQQLRSIATYLCMLGEDQAALSVENVLLKLDQLCGERMPDRCMSLMRLAQTCLDLGYAERVPLLLARSQTAEVQRTASKVSVLEHKVVTADYLLTLDKLEECSAAIMEAKSVATESSVDIMVKDQRHAFEVVHAKAWLLTSKLKLATGGPKEALHAAKQAVQILNSVWASIERSAGVQESTTTMANVAMEPDSEATSAVTGLAKGISKLQLTPTEDQKVKDSEQQNKRGASFWPVVPTLLKALLHLSDVYAHHGLFNESDYYSQRAIQIGEAVGSTSLLSRVRSHRSRLLTLAGRCEEAELCLTQDSDIDFDSSSLSSVERCRAKAEIRVREGALPAALDLYQKAVRMLDQMNSEDFLARLENIGDGDSGLVKRLAALSLEKQPLGKSKSQTRKAVERPGNKVPSRQKPEAGLPSLAIASKSNAIVEPRVISHVLQRMTAMIFIEMTLISLRLGSPCAEVLRSVGQYRNLVPDSLRGRMVGHQAIARKATDMFGLNVTLSLLTESTLSVPAFVASDERKAGGKEKTAASDLKKTTKATGKTTKNAVVSQESPGALLYAARNTLSNDIASSLHMCSTSQAHSAYTTLSGTSLLVSAIADSQAIQAIIPKEEAMSVDIPRIKALRYEQSSVAVDVAKNDDPLYLAWPDTARSPELETVSAPDFQSSFLDILPKTWTAVSLCLNEDGSELLIARYRAGVSPLILKVPFSRHTPGDDDDVDDSRFDYHKGKAELQEIIELSNYTCHNPGSLNAKGAKTKWWEEREDLDRRLHELLINMENIWFGGFRAVFSLLKPQSDALSRFRASFEQILTRYLPSRMAAKFRSEQPIFHDQILELFTGLGSDNDGIVDLEEPVTDLLYFVVDMLQFRGERNAYDEIDFDSMAVDVLDKLRAYHDATVQANRSSEHLILVLDRRLQAFPWESMPCLEGSSVSRVGSMLSLRDCILSMRGPTQSSRASSFPDEGRGCHVVCRDSGTYILNPSSDLAPTQAMLEPALSTLTTCHGSRWTSVVNEIPSEDRFRSALNNSSVMLYFGHGAGSQYIRPRTIKRLERCSEVVWLMGCSSGAVWEYGDLEPCAVPLAYLLAGIKESTRDSEALNVESPSKCMSVVATLWDVTDKDIDRFSIAIGEDWGLWPASGDKKAPAKTPKKRVIMAQPSTPVQVPKTPKTPKVHKTPAVARTPATSRTKPNKADGTKFSLVEAVARSRDACYLRYLNGAAPVVYGIPVYLGD